MKKLVCHSKLKAIFASFLMLPALTVIAQDNTDAIFQETFDSEENFGLWKNIDLNGGRAWEFLRGTAAYMLDYQTGLPGDDWLISPAFTLDENYVYQLSFSMNVANPNKVESLAAAIGLSDDVSAMTTILVDYPQATQADNGIKTVKIIPTTSGNHHIGFHAYSQPNQMRIEVDNVTVTRISLKTVPEQVAGLTAVAGENGALTATVSFTTPSCNAAGEALDELTYVNIYRNDSQEASMTFQNPEKGNTLTWTDTTPAAGFNTYTVIAGNTSGNSTSEQITVFVGSDIPQSVSAINAKRNKNLSTTVTWDAPTASVNGGYIDFSSIRYQILRNGESIEESYDGTSYNDEVPVERGQAIISYEIIPFTETGEGAGTTSNEIVCGTPLAVPYEESFANGTFAENYPWHQDASINDLDWLITGDDEAEEVVTYDNDGGMIMVKSTYAYSGDNSMYVSPILDLSGVDNPVLTFYLYHAQSPWYDPEWDGIINDRIEVRMQIDGGEWQQLENAIFYNGKDNDGWVKCEVYLPNLEGSYVNIGLLAVVENDSGSYRNIYVDKITIDEAPYQKDLAIKDFTVDKKRISVGETTTFSTTVNNRGSESTAAYALNIYKNDALFTSIKGQEIAATQNIELNFNFMATLEDAQNDEISWKAEIEYDEDQYDGNNSSEILATSVRKPEVPSVTNLSAILTESETVQLQWDAASSVPESPKQDPVKITDDFESYDSFIIDEIGEWTLIDLDGSTTLSSPRIPEDYPHRGEPMAFQVFNAPEAGVVTDEYVDNALMPHSGDQYLICPSTDYPAENNDWLISPRLDGRAQTISFYAKAASYDSEWIRVYYSTTDTHPDSFTKISEGEQVYVYDWWNEYTYDLPEGARYFAIQCCRRTVFLLIDDITYNCHDGNPDPVTLIGYNVYRNGDKINDNVLTDNFYEDADVTENEEYTYRVTAVYGEGESNYSDEAYIFVSGVAQTGIDSSASVYATGNEIIVKSAMPADVSIWTLDGKRIYYEQDATNVAVTLEKGVYIATVGNLSRKVVL